MRRVYPRAPEWSLTFWESNEFRNFLDTLFRPERTEGFTEASRALVASNHRRLLTESGFRWVTVDKWEIPPELLDHTLLMLREMAPKRIYEDDDLAVFEFQPQIEDTTTRF